jgi:hypothetical protein
MRVRNAMVGVAVLLVLSSLDPADAQQQRTEAQARQTAARLRAERERLRVTTGAGPELISSYMRALIQPPPGALGVDPFYRKHVDADGIPVLASGRVPDDALLVARDIVNSMLAMRPDVRQALIERRWRRPVRCPAA